MPQSKGKITWIGETTIVSETFKKRDFAIEVTQVIPDTGEEWKHEESFQLGNNNVTLLDGLSLGQKVDVTYGVRSNKTEREGVTRYFTNLNAFKVETMETLGELPANTSTADDGLPF